MFKLPKLIHQDIKPNNILARKKKQNANNETFYEFRLIDFGMSHIMYHFKLIESINIER